MLTLAYKRATQLAIRIMPSLAYIALLADRCIPSDPWNLKEYEGCMLAEGSSACKAKGATCTWQTGWSPLCGSAWATSLAHHALCWCPLPVRVVFSSYSCGGSSRCYDDDEYIVCALPDIRVLIPCFFRDIPWTEDCRQWFDSNMQARFSRWTRKRGTRCKFVKVLTQPSSKRIF